MKIKYIILLACCCLCWQRCTNVLDIAPDGRETLANIFADNDKTSAFLNSCYMSIPEKGLTYDWVTNAPTALSDEGYIAYEVQEYLVPKMYANTASASIHPLRDNNSQYVTDNNLYMNYMTQIRLCTLFIENIDKANVNNESDRARWRAEAHVLRAYFMSELVKWFGGFAYEAHGYSADYDYSTLVKKSVWELAMLIEQECDKAINTPELPWRIALASDQLRVTKALAWSIKSKMYLFAASPLHNEDNEKERWIKAYESNKDAVKALEANGYALKTVCLNTDMYKGPAAAYYELFTTILSSSEDKETIWQSQRAMDLRQWSYVGSKTWQTSGRGGICPTQEMVDSYEVTNADRTESEPLLALENPYDASHNTPNYNTKALDLGYNPNDPYNCNRDPRMDVTIIRNGDKINWLGEEKTVETYIGGDNGISNDPTEPKYTRTGYYFRKHVKPDSDPSNKYTAANWKYFRLAEIKLNYAEAAAQAGELGEAMAQVNDIRSRVGMPALPTNLSQQDLLLRIYNERRVELVFEECRYFDLRRWQDPYEGDLTATCGTMTAMEITKKADGTFTYTRKANLSNKSCRNRDLLMPLPQNEAMNLKALTKKNWQNPGW